MFLRMCPRAPLRFRWLLNHLYTQVLAVDVPFGEELGSSSTRLGGQLLALNYVDNGQVNAQIPCTLEPNTQHDLQVIHGDAQSVTEPVVVSDTQPALYTANAAGF